MLLISRPFVAISFRHRKIPRATYFPPSPDIRRHNKGRPSEMSREIVPVEFINFLWGILIVLICWPREGTPPASRIRRYRGGKGYNGIRSFNLQDRSLSRPSDECLPRSLETYTLRTISERRTHLSSPSAFGGMLIQSSVSEMGCWFHLRNHRSPIFSSKSYRRISTRRKLRPALNATGHRASREKWIV